MRTPSLGVLALAVTSLLHCAPAADSPAASEASVVAAVHEWDLNDVSMLLPHPRAEDMSRLLQPSSAGGRGALLPEPWLEKIPDEPLNKFVINVAQDVALGGVRVIAIRLDPCFKEAPADRCRATVRMSWQPFTPSASDPSKVDAVDAALHSFYELTARDFEALANRLWKIRRSAAVTGKPLGVHPVLEKEGFGGTYWAEVSQAILAYCGEESLLRMTMMQLGGRTNTWTFRGVQRQGGTIAPMVIPRTNGSDVQMIAVHAQPPFHFDGGLFRSTLSDGDRLEPKGQDELNLFLRGTAMLPLGTDETRTRLGKVLDTTQFLEVPSTQSTSETIDCASCHIAQASRAWINKWSPTLVPTGPGFSMPAGTNFDLTNVSTLTGLTNQLRAFGYFGEKVVVSQRVIFESATVAAEMRSAY